MADNRMAVVDDVFEEQIISIGFWSLVTLFGVTEHSHRYSCIYKIFHEVSLLEHLKINLNIFSAIKHTRGNFEHSYFPNTLYYNIFKYEYICMCVFEHKGLQQIF